MSRNAVLTVATNFRSATGFASQAMGLARSARARVGGSEKAEMKMLRMPNRSRISAAALNAVARAGEPDIHQDQFRLTIGDELNRFFRRRSDVDNIVARFGQCVFELKRDQIVVFHDQDTAAARILSP